MIYILNIEPLKERYTEWWVRYIPDKFNQIGLLNKTIEGTSLTETVETGTVLDAAGTNYYKNAQLQKICQMFYNKEIKAYDAFLVCDIWFPGIEMIRYMSDLYKIPVRIYGVWHAGSTTINDFAQPMHRWSKDFEIGFLNICDYVFVGTEYSKNSIINRLLAYLPDDNAEEIAKKIIATGMPLNYANLQQYSSETKENIIVFPHRPDPEKNPNIFIDLIYALSTFWDDFENYQFRFCTSRKLYRSSSALINAQIARLGRDFENVEIYHDMPKEDYYKLLGKSKLMISTTSEENFGYCAVEAMALGCPVLLPNRFSHPELVENDYTFLYDKFDDLLDKVPKLLGKEHNFSKELKAYAEPYGYVINRWVEYIRG